MPPTEHQAEEPQPAIFITGISNAAYEGGSVNDVSGCSQSKLPTVAGQAKEATPRNVSQQDHGYAWIILLASCASCLVVSIGETIVGVLIIELERTFVDATPVELNIASTAQLSVALIISVFTSLCISAFGARATVMTGALIAGAGFLASSFVTNIYVFIFVYGVLSAIGVSLMLLGGMIPLYEYFDKHKALALGCAMSSVNAGFLVWPPLLTVLFDYYGWRGSFVILAGFLINGCVFGALLRPFKAANKENHVNENHSAKSGLMSQSKVFKNTYLLLFCVITCVNITGLTYGVTYLPTLGEEAGASETNAALLVSVAGVSNCVSGVVNGYIGDLPWFRDNRLLISVYAYVIAGVSKICSILATTYTHLALFAVADGFAAGAILGTVYAAGIDLVRIEHRELASGVINAFAGVGVLIGNLLSGWMYSYSGNLAAPAVVLGCVQLAAAVMMICLYAHIKVRKKNSFEVTAL